MCVKSVHIVHKKYDALSLSVCDADCYVIWCIVQLSLSHCCNAL